MSDLAWETEHSVEVAASQAFVWSYMSDVTNWDDPPARFQLIGPFATGGQGTTEIPGQAPRKWLLRDVEPIQSYAIEFSLERATISFEWRFNQLREGETRLSQRIVLRGEGASDYVEDVRRGFESGLAPGMNRIASAICRSLASTKVVAAT